MGFVTGSELGTAMLKALQVADTRSVLSLTIFCEAGSLATVTLVRALPQGSGVAAKSVLEQYRLEPVSSKELAELAESVSLETLTRTTHLPTDSLGSDRT